MLGTDMWKASRESVPGKGQRDLGWGFNVSARTRRRRWKNGNPHTLLVGMWNGGAIVENSVIIPQYAKCRVTL